MRLFSVMGWIHFKLLCTRFLSHPWEVTAGLFAPAVWRVRYALACWRMVDRKKKTGGLFYECFEG